MKNQNSLLLEDSERLTGASQEIEELQRSLEAERLEYQKHVTGLEEELKRVRLETADREEREREMEREREEKEEHPPRDFTKEDNSVNVEESPSNESESPSNESPITGATEEPLIPQEGNEG